MIARPKSWPRSQPTFNRRAPAPIETIVANLADAEDQSTVAKKIAAIDDLDLLINAAGFGAPGAFQELPIETHLDMLNVHVTSTVRLCHATLDGMVSRRSGAIINICALAMYLHIEGNVMYGATKRFVDTFTRSLHEDVSEHGVKLQILIPGYTRTPFHDTEYYDGEAVGRIPGFLWMPVDKVTSTSLRALSSRNLVCVPGLVHRSLYLIFRSGLFSYALVRRLIV